MKKIAASLAAVALLSGSLAMQPAMAKDKDGERAAAIAGVIALGLLGAAVAQHQHKEGHDEYRHHPKLHSDENAVGACMHRARRMVKRAGGHNAKLNKVDRVRKRDNGNTVVVFHATGYYDFGHKRSKVRCVVKNHKVIKFEFS